MTEAAKPASKAPRTVRSARRSCAVCVTLTQSDSQTASEVLGGSVDGAHGTPTDHVAGQSKFGTDFPCQHDTGYDEGTEGYVED